MSFFRSLIIFMTFVLTLMPIASADQAAVLAGSEHFQGSRPDGHAPITVMGDHVHKKGEWMLSYRYMAMRMSGSRKGHHDISNAGVLADFMVTPTDMTMQMHMLGLMIAPSDYVTFMAMLPIIRKDMDHRMRNGRTFQTHSDGLGDLTLSALIPVFEKGRHKIHLNAGFSAPIGEIDEHADLPTGPNQRMPYPMQLGSGTWDILPGITYTRQSDDWSWGAQAKAEIRPGRNRIGYSLGNRYETTFWGAYRWCDWLSNSVGVKYSIWSNIGGRDPGLVPAMVPTADPDSRGGKRMDFLFGLNFYVPKGVLKGQRLAIDFGIPFMQSLDGPQLETDWYFTAGWQAAFG